MVLLESVGVGATVAAGVIAQMPVAPESLEAVGKWPVTMALIVLAGWSVWLAFRMADKSRQSQDKQTEVLRGLVEQLARLNERVK
jgi:hypothetical protein